METDSYHLDSAEVVRQDQRSSRRSAWRRPRSFAPLAAGTVIACFIAAGWWIGNRVRVTTAAQTRQSLEALVESTVQSVDLWMTARQNEAESLEANEPLLQTARTILADAPQSPESSRGIQDQVGSLENQLLPHLANSVYFGWLLCDSDGRVVTASVDDLNGKTVLIPPDSMTKLLSRESTVCRPFPAPAPLRDEGPLKFGGNPIMATIVPVTRGGRTDGLMMLLIDPSESFFQLFETARAGPTSETIALDRSGTLISPSRHESLLREAGVMSKSGSAGSALNVQLRVRDDLSQTPVSKSSRRRPLTLMADQVTRGSKGVHVDGYIDYRGRNVVAAWQWLPDDEFGVATKIDVDQVYAHLNVLRNVFWSLLALLVVGSVVWVSHQEITDRIKFRSPSDDRSSRRLGAYELKEVVGQGGMGAVYRGTHDVLKRDVAVKVLEGDDATSLSLLRFEREVQLTARLRHPNTIAIYDYGRTKDDTFYYVMEFVDGITLQQLIDQFGRQPPARVIHLLLQICGSLGEAHQLGLVHRDIKPANILVSARSGLYDMVKVLDFGLVKEIDRESTEVTVSDAITGTPMYMSPESVRNARLADERSDLYSIGAVGYTLLTGVPTFEGEAAVDICLKQLDEEPLRPSDRIGAPLPEDLQNVLMSCLRKDPEERPQRVDDLADALRQCLDAYHWNAGDAYRWWEEALANAETGTARHQADDIRAESQVAQTETQNRGLPDSRNGLRDTKTH